MESPRFTHDCDSCTFLGTYEEHDLYFCPREPTVIARASSEGPDYCSGIVSARMGHPLLVEALYRARERGLYTGK